MSWERDRIVFLDAGTVDYGDLPLSLFEKLGDFKAYPQSTPAQIKPRLKAVSIAIANKCRFDRRLIGGLSSLRLLNIAATGVNNVDLEAARAKGLAVTNVKGYSTETVVQFTFSFLLALAGNLVKYNAAAHDGSWSRSRFFTYGKYPIQEVAGKKLGIVGYGAIGRRVAQVARALGMKVLVAAIPGKKYTAAEKKTRVPFDRMIRESDFVTIHAPLTDLTRGLIHKGVLNKMKKGTCLLNMARGGIVDEPALRKALESGRLAGAASDVLTEEPPSPGHVLLKAPNLILTPHIAWASREARARLVREIAANIRAFQAGRVLNRVA